MASRTDVARLDGTLRDVSRLAARDLERLWATVDVGNAVAARTAVEEFLPLLVARYGEVAAVVAADWYDELRATAGVRGRFGAVLADLPDAEAVRVNGRWAVGPLFAAEPDGAATVGRLGQVLDRMALQPGRSTVARSVRLDPADARWARVPQSTNPCAFCRLLASRGADYRTQESAGGLDPDSYHANCGCVPTPFWPGQDYPAGYDPDALFEQYQDAVAAAGTGSPKAVLSSLRELQGSH